MYLIIDTSTHYGAIALWKRDAPIAALQWRSDGSHTKELIPSIDTLLSRTGESLDQLKGIVVAVGPGGFSTLRAGMGAAKGLSFGRDVPLVGISSLEASCYPYRGLGYTICALLEAGRDLVAWARFRQIKGKWYRRTPDQVTPLAEVTKVKGRHILFCGEGVATYAAQLREALGDHAHTVTQPFPFDRLCGVASLGLIKLATGESDSVAGLQPHYLRPPSVTQPRPPRVVRR